MLYINSLSVDQQLCGQFFVWPGRSHEVLKKVEPGAVWLPGCLPSFHNADHYAKVAIGLHPAFFGQVGS
jgi:hypothetical protein